MSTKSKDKPKSNRGSKSKYITLKIEERLTEIKQWRREGLTEAQICAKLGVSVRSCSDYKRDHPLFLQALRHSKQALAADISDSIFKRTLATERTVVKKKWVYKKNEETGEMDKILVSHIEETTPREVTAQDIKVAKFLMNEWRKIEEVQIDATIKLPDCAIASDQKVLDLLGFKNEDDDPEEDDPEGECED